MGLSVEIGMSVDLATLEPTPILTMRSSDSGMAVQVPLSNESLADLAGSVFRAELIMQEARAAVEAASCETPEEVIEVLAEIQAKHFAKEE